MPSILCCYWIKAFLKNAPLLMLMPFTLVKNKYISHIYTLKTYRLMSRDKESEHEYAGTKKTFEAIL